MTNVFLAIPQYKKLRPEEQNRIAKELNMDWWKPSLEGFHPMFDHSVASSFDNPYRIRYSLITRDGNLPRARSLNFGIWRKEYDNPEFKCDYFMIMDDDLSFTPESIDILIKDDKPIVGGIYTFKSTDPNHVGKGCTRFLNKHDFSPDEPFKVRWLNGGFIMVQAKTLFAMIDAYPELMYDVPKGNAHNIEKTWALWTPMVHEAENERFYLDEGWAFCQRARQIGYDIWADLRVKLIHWDAEFGYAIGL
jgi:hypothetical protein